MKINMEFDITNNLYGQSCTTDGILVKFHKSCRDYMLCTMDIMVKNAFMWENLIKILEEELYIIWLIGIAVLQLVLLVRQ